MISQISGPCCDSDIEPDHSKSFVWESHIRQQIFVIWKFFNNIYPENNQCVPKQR